MSVDEPAAITGAAKAFLTNPSLLAAALSRPMKTSSVFVDDIDPAAAIDPFVVSAPTESVPVVWIVPDPAFKEVTVAAPDEKIPVVLIAPDPALKDVTVVAPAPSVPPTVAFPVV